ncbi:MAG TPA: tetratricopeptide repeat protein [Rubricoccaceae bacterium]|nr:tetratricopeptide repeat protein [Rubricoccaceae bacterium]
MTPAHEREHIERAGHHLAAAPEALRRRWEHALQLFDQARPHDAFVEFNEVLRGPGLDTTGRTHVQLQAVRALRDAPIERMKTELALIEPQDPYQTIVLDYRLGWLMRHRLASFPAAQQYFDRVRDEARRLGSRAWEVAALLQKGGVLAAQGQHEQAIELYMRVYNLSRRNGFVEFIPKALLYKGYSLVKLGRPQKGEEQMLKAYELACRNRLQPERGVVLHALAQVYHYDFKFYGLALEYYDQARRTFERVPVWASVIERLEEDHAACQRELAELDLAKIIGPVPINKLRQEYLTSLVNGFVGIPGIDNRSQLGERIGLTRQAIHRNING